MYDYSSRIVRYSIDRQREGRKLYETAVSKGYVDEGVSMNGSVRVKYESQVGGKTETDEYDYTPLGQKYQTLSSWKQEEEKYFSANLIENSFLSEFKGEGVGKYPLLIEKDGKTYAIFNNACFDEPDGDPWETAVLTSCDGTHATVTLKLKWRVAMDASDAVQGPVSKTVNFVNENGGWRVDGGSYIDFVLNRQTVSPETGDNTALFAVCSVVALAALAAVCVKASRRRRETA